jgi:hypothetical protein
LLLSPDRHAAFLGSRAGPVLAHNKEASSLGQDSRRSRGREKNAPGIDAAKLSAFILSAQDPEKGGIADRPDDVADVWHTVFGLAGAFLSVTARGMQ